MSPPPSAAASVGDLLQAPAPRAVVVDLDDQRAGHVLDRDGRLGGGLGRGQRVTHHAVGAAVHDRRDVPRLTGTVERDGHLRAADQRLYLVQARHHGRFYVASLRRL